MIGGLMDAPLLIQPLILPKEVQRQAHHMDVAWSYSLDFYSCTEASMSPGDARKKGNVQIIMDRLGKEEQYCNFGFTHDTDAITIKQSRSSYSTLVTLTEKLDRQIEIAQKIAAVNPNDVVKSVLRTHLLPDIIGNTKAFTSQRFRCKSCSAKYRRMPVIGVCLSCGGELQPSVTRGSVQKYLQLGLRLSQKYDVGEYLRNRFILASEELATLFVPDGHQGDINDYFSSSSQLVVGEKELEKSTVVSQLAPSLTDNNNPQMLVLGQQTTKDHLTEEEKTAKFSRKRSSNSKTAEQYQTTLF